MTIEQIKRLLDKYWAGDTSLEEESALKTFFSGDSIPEDLRKHKPLFLWKANQLQLKRTGMSKIESGKKFGFRWYSFIRAAAVVLLILAFGIGIYTHYQQEKYVDKVLSETCSEPKDTLQEPENVIGKVSSALNVPKDNDVETQMHDSLEQTSKSSMFDE